jgi:predicted 3-demethylubiquinone-9 3-methyltransferase (glyoxalase superfamily)
MQKIIPYLSFQEEAEEAVNYYISLFEKSKIISSIYPSATSSKDALVIKFQLADLMFSAENSGRKDSLNGSISLMVSCYSVKEVNRLYEALVQGGKVHIPLDYYDFCNRYAWVADKYGLNWQLMYVEGKEEKHSIKPSLLFSMDMCGKAEDALNYYLSVFKDSSKGYVSHYKVGEASDRRAKTNYAQFNLFGQQLILMDHGYGGKNTFNKAFSLAILSSSEEERDAYLSKLSSDPTGETKGWVKDQFGVSWQIIFDNAFNNKERI